MILGRILTATNTFWVIESKHIPLNTQCLCAEVVWVLQDCFPLCFSYSLLTLAGDKSYTQVTDGNSNTELEHGRYSLEVVCWLNGFVFWENIGHQFRAQIPWSCLKAPSIFDLVHWLVCFQNLSFDEKLKKKQIHSHNGHETFLSVWEFSNLLIYADVLGWAPAKISSSSPTLSVNREHQRKAVWLL